MSPDPSHLIRTILTATATFLGLLLLVSLWTVYGPTYDAQAAPLDATSTAPTASEPCPAGEATGGTCGSEGQIDGPNSPSQSTDTTPAPQRRCKGCRLTQEEYDARQADKQAAHDRAEARKQRGAERRADAQRKREERAARKTSKSSTTKSSSSRASNSAQSSSNGSNSQDGTDTPEDTSSASQDAPETSSDAPTSDDTTATSDDPGTPAPYAPLEIPEASHKPAPYDASKDPFEVRREAARQAADAVNHSSDRVKAPAASSPSPASTPTPASGYWAEQMPTWALGLIGFLAASGLIVYKISRPRSDLQGDRRS